MSEGTQEVADQEEDKAAAKRKTLSLGERIKVVDFLRAQVEPIACDSNAEVAAMVSEGAKVEINWSQLKYMLDELEKDGIGLSAKVRVKSPLSIEEQLQAASEKSIELEARVILLEQRLAGAETIIQSLVHPLLKD